MHACEKKLYTKKYLGLCPSFCLRKPNLEQIDILVIQDPIRKIPGPPGVPLLGNVLSINLPNLHNQFYEIAKKYGPVTKIHVLNTPIVVLNSTEVCLEALVRTGKLLYIDYLHFLHI